MEKSKKINRKKEFQGVNKFVLRGRVKGRVRCEYERDRTVPGGRRLCKIRFRLEVILGRWYCEEFVLYADDRKSMMGVLWGEETREMIDVEGWLDVRKVESPGGVVEVPVLEVGAVGPAGSWREMESK